MVFTPLTTLHGLLEFGLTPSDLIALYTYIQQGPHHPLAPKGICVGSNLNREERTSAYRLLTKAYKGIESKTIDYKQQVLPSFPFYIVFKLSTTLTVEIYEAILEAQGRVKSEKAPSRDIRSCSFCFFF